MANILVYVELVDDAASWASLLSLRQARYLATNVGATIYAVLPCATPPMYGENDIIAVLSRQGADKVILMTHGDLSQPILFESHGEALLTAANQFPPAMLLMPDGPAAVEIAPRVAARLGGLFVRHPELSVQDGKSLRIDQPLFEETHVRRFESENLEHSVVAVVAPDPQQFAQPLGTEEAEVVVISPGFAEEGIPSHHKPVDGEAATGRPSRILLAGSGVTEPAEVEAIEKLAALLKAELRLTETAAEKGLLKAPTLEEPALVCHPELVLAFGVQGTRETLAHVPDTAYLVSVNPDAESPLFKRAQLGLVAPILDTVQQMLDDTEAHAGEPLLPVAEDPPPPSAEDDSDGDDETGEQDALRDTLPPGTKTDDTREAAATEEMDATSEDEAEEGSTAKPEDAEDASPPAELSMDPAVAATIRPIDSLAHTPPMGTPLSLELKKALAAAGDPPPPMGAANGASPAPSEPSADRTPEAAPAGVVAEGIDPALDDTVPAPLPGADQKSTKDDEPSTATKSDSEPEKKP